MKKTLIILLLILPISLAGVAFMLFISFYTGYDIYRDISYGESESNLMDIYIPNKADKRDENGCVMFIHGGGWMGGDKSEEELRCRLLASRGYVAITVNYTLWSEANKDNYTVFSVLDELDRALLFVREFANERGISIDMAATSGYSAGAHLSLLYSYSRPDTAPLKIKFASSMAGPVDISKDVWGEETAATIGRLLLGYEISPDMLEDEDVAAGLASVSPTSYVGRDTPPTLFIQGKKDNIVPLENARMLEMRLMENFVPFDAIYSGRSDHSLSQNSFKYIKYHKKLLDYCENYFGY